VDAAIAEASVAQPTTAPTRDTPTAVDARVAEELQRQARIEAAVMRDAVLTPTPEVIPNTVVSPSLASSFTLSVSETTRAIPRYTREHWKHWIDEDGDCHNTRAEVLLDESLSTVVVDGCRVVLGQWLALYTGTVLTDAGSLDVDHMVPLANAHSSGGWAWDAARKQAYANDLTDTDHLIAVTASANRSKGAKGPEDWRPPDVSYWCEYATDWARIKDRWNLSATSTELIALRDMLGGCLTGVQIIGVDVPRLLPELSPTTTPVAVGGALLYDPFGSDRNCGDFSRWMDAQAFYEAAGGPVTDPHRLDGDRDGIACTSLAGAP
jgi:hypothetical protein